MKHAKYISILVIDLDCKAFPSILKQTQFTLHVFTTVFVKTTLLVHNQIHFNSHYSLFSHIAQEANEIRYPGRPVNARHRYRIYLPLCIKWPHNEYLKVSICSKLLYATSEVINKLKLLRLKVTSTMYKLIIYSLN